MLPSLSRQHPQHAAVHKLFGVSLLGLLLCGIIFVSVIQWSTHSRLAFRDLSHFYLPLYESLDQRASTQWFPQWSPHDRFGIPLAGDSTTALYYPLRALFLLPLSLEARTHCYLLIHLLIAGLGVYLASRHQDCQPFAALIAAVTYTLSGGVFFLYTNPPFLVGAAWLPWLLPELLRFGQQLQPGSIVKAAITTALPVLGGDPQTVFCAYLVAAVWLAADIGVRSHRQQKHFLLRRVSIAIPFFVGLLLAAPQVAASWHWSQQSWRQETAAPNIWQSAFSNAQTVPEEWHTHAEDVYRYSVPPWHAVELLTPYFSGRLAPNNERWLEAFTAEEQTWTPTLYCGLVSAVVFLGCLLMGGHRTRWSYFALATLLLAFGHFGLGYAYKTIAHWFDAQHAVGIPSAFAGPHWIIEKLVPGFNQFRYPAKWLVFVSLGLSLHTSFQLSHLTPRLLQNLQRVIVSLAVLMTILLVVSSTTLFYDGLSDLCSTRRTTDRFWGPVDPQAALSTIRTSLGHTLVLAILFGVVLRRFISQRDSLHRNNAGPVSFSRAGKRILVTMVVIDCGLVASWQTITAPLTPQPLQINRQSHRYLLAENSPPWPEAWRWEQAHADRAELVEQSQRSTWFVRWQLADQATVLNNQVSLPSAASTAFWQRLSQLQRLHPAVAADQLQSVARYLAVDTLAIRQASPLAHSPTSQLSLRPVAKTQPLLRWHPIERVTTIDRSTLKLRDGIQQLIDEIIRTGGNPSPTIQSASKPPEVIGEEQPSVSLDQSLSAANDARNDRTITGVADEATSPGVRDSLPRPRQKATLKDLPFVSSLVKFIVISSSPEQLRLQVSVDQPGLLHRIEYQDGNWHARYRASGDVNWTETNVLQVDWIGQGISLLQGTYEIEFYYAPWWRLPAWGLSIATLIALCLILLKNNRQAWFWYQFSPKRSQSAS